MTLLRLAAQKSRSAARIQCDRLHKATIAGGRCHTSQHGRPMHPQAYMLLHLAPMATNSRVTSEIAAGTFDRGAF